MTYPQLYPSPPPPEIDLDRLHASTLHDLRQPVPPPEVIVSVGSDAYTRSRLFTLGNFSVLIGKAKARKTYLMSAIAAAALGNTTILGGLCGDLPPERRKVILFDTEQGDWDAANVSARIWKLSGVTDPVHFQVHFLRPLTPAERVKLIEYEILTNPDTGLVIVDGLRDLLTKGINDEEEATELTSKFLRWTHEYKVHMLFILHQNKGDNNARGHIGTEVVNKAETVISVAKHEKRKDLSIVTAEYCRGIEFEPFTFFVNGEGMPELINNIMDEGSNKDRKVTSNMKAIFLQSGPMPYSNLVDAYCVMAGCSAPTAKRAIGDSLKNGLLSKTETGDYRLNRDEPLKSYDDDEDDQIPF